MGAEHRRGAIKIIMADTPAVTGENTTAQARPRMALRRFSAERLVLCRDWFDSVETKDEWDDKGSIGPGESRAIKVSRKADGLLGAAKPGEPKADGVCRAAHEKIAFDLAHELDFPVPPVILWDRGDGQGVNRYLAISAWAFQQCASWDAACSKGTVSESDKASISEPCSAMRVFHTWIGDCDRKTEHVQVDEDSPDGDLAIAFIDHAYSMSQQWKGPDAAIQPSPHYMPLPEEREAMLQAVERIEVLSDEEIKRIVERIPETYLPAAEKGHIIANLISRKAKLRQILGLQ